MTIPEHIQVDSMFLMYIILAVVLGFAIYYLRQVDKDKKLSYSLMDLITSDGKIQERKVTRFGAWIVSTWGFVYLIIQDRLDEWYFVGYISVWVANAILGKDKQPTQTKEDDSTHE